MVPYTEFFSPPPPSADGPFRLYDLYSKALGKALALEIISASVCYRTAPTLRQMAEQVLSPLPHPPLEALQPVALPV